MRGVREAVPCSCLLLLFALATFDAPGVLPASSHPTRSLLVRHLSMASYRAASTPRPGVVRLRGGFGAGDMDLDHAEDAGGPFFSKGGGPGTLGATGAEADANEAAGKKRRRKLRRGSKDDPAGKRKHRGRRGGKYAKAARAERAAKPLDEELEQEVVSLATTLAEISAAAPFATEQSGPTQETDPVMKYITPEKYDGLDDLKRSTIYDERMDLLALGDEFAERMHGAPPPPAWEHAWFGSKRGNSGGATRSGDEVQLPKWANRSLSAQFEVPKP